MMHGEEADMSGLCCDRGQDLHTQRAVHEKVGRQSYRMETMRFQPGQQGLQDLQPLQRTHRWKQERHVPGNARVQHASGSP